MLASARAIGEYTEAHILPKLTAMSPNSFEPEQVPYYASRTVFHTVTGKAALYTFRFPTFNPTNPIDRPVPFELELMNRFRDEANLNELTGVQSLALSKVFYLAQPIRIEDQECLTCHSSPDRAPHAMVAQFGPVDGFGWKLHETVGMEILTVPLTEQLRGTLRLVLFVAGSLLLIFIAAYTALSMAFETALVRPLSSLANAADAASRTTERPLAAPSSAVREIRVLTEALERLRLSLSKALSALAKAGSPAPDQHE